MTPWEEDKRKRNLASGYQETKGLKDGHCNRYACQAPLLGHPQWSMEDFEVWGSGQRLFYCQSCAFRFNEADDQYGDERRCRLEAPR